VRRSASPARGSETPSPSYGSRSPSPPMPEPHPHLHQRTGARPSDSPASAEEDLPPLPNPNVSVEDEDQGQLDERSLNVLAAREISKQMGMSGSPLSPPSLPFAGRKSVSPRPSFTTDIPPSDNNNRFGQIAPPSPQFTSSMENRDVTPTPDRQQSPQLPPPPPLPAGAMSHSTSVDSDPTELEDPYHTPPEYLRNLSTPPSPRMLPAPSPLQVQIPKMSPTLGSASTPTTTKKISAAAFRRPGMRTTGVRGDSFRQDSMGFRPSPGRSPSRERGENENLGVIPEQAITPLSLRKKSLPSVPGPAGGLLSGTRDQGVPRSVSSPFPDLRTSEEQERGGGRLAGLTSSPEPRPRESMIGEDEFDYLSAYMNEDERRESGIQNGGTNGYEHSGGGPGR
jgi:hypothetical protein